MAHAKKALILGTSGRFGRHCLNTFLEAGWSVTAFSRSQDDLETAIQGQDIVINGWNPPYQHWARDFPKLDKALQQAALRANVPVLLAANIYGYGQHALGTIDAGTPKAAQNQLGIVRNQQEESYRASGVKTIVLRSGDYWDTAASGNWLDRIILAKINEGVMTYPGKIDQTHAWAYLPDLARLTLDIAHQIDEFNDFDEILFPGFALTAEEISQVLRNILGHEIQLKQMNWTPIWLSHLFWPMAKHLSEMRYLWDTAHIIDGRIFHERFPNFVQTNTNHALKAAVNPLL